jgi:hypothetical protein
MSSVDKARISACDEKGSEEKSGAFFVQFNPNEITIAESACRFSEKRTDNPKKNNAASQRTPAKAQADVFDESKGITFSTKLFFNTYSSVDNECRDVRALISKFDRFLNRNAKSARDKGLVRILFAWGSMQVFGLLTSMSVSYMMFSSKGLPVRAEAAITITGDYVKYVPESAPKDVKSVTFAADKKSGFADALEDYKNDIKKLKSDARKNGVVNLRLMA